VFRRRHQCPEYPCPENRCREHRWSAP
jgi:hypothetical protein